MKSFEKTVPEGYSLALYIDARKMSFGIIFNVIALLVMTATVGIALIPILMGGGIMQIFDSDPTVGVIVYLSFMASIIIYTVLHELVHGAAYKILTGEKLTFGMSWSCAYCGVPNVHVYRYVALVAVCAPLVLFTLLFVPLTVWLYGVNYLAYVAAAALLGIHLGGCSGDIYVLLLLLFRFKDRKTLMRDTGPEQFFYTYEGTVIENAD